LSYHTTSKSRYLPYEYSDKASSSNTRKNRLEEDHSDEEEDGWFFTPEMYAILDRCEWINEELADGGLRKLMVDIDTAGNRADRLNALNTEKLRNPMFLSFINKLLIEVGILKKDDTCSGGLALTPPESLIPDHAGKKIPITKKIEILHEESISDSSEDASVGPMDEIASDSN